MEFDMVFEGGGAKGMVFVGAMEVIEERNHSARRLVGTSAGAITATLLAAGYSAAEMKEALGETTEDGSPVFATFMDAPTADDFTAQDIEKSVTMALFDKIDMPGVPQRFERKLDRWLIKRLLSLPVYPTLFSFTERGGLYVGKAFVEWLKRKLDEKGDGLGDMTFEAFHDATKSDLSVVASDTKNRMMRVLNHRTAPNCPVVWAVRMSMSIPFAWHEVRWKLEWDPYRRLKENGGADEESLAGNTFVDGGVLSNFPINLLTSKDRLVKAVMGNTDPDAADTLGFLIDESIDVPGAPPAPDDDDVIGDVVRDVKRLPTVRRARRLLNTMTEARDNRLIELHKEKICHLPAKGYETMEFDMTKPRRDALIAAGQQAMREHLDGRKDQSTGSGESA